MVYSHSGISFFVLFQCDIQNSTSSAVYESADRGKQTLNFVTKQITFLGCFNLKLSSFCSKVLHKPLARHLGITSITKKRQETDNAC